MFSEPHPRRTLPIFRAPKTITTHPGGLIPDRRSDRQGYYLARRWGLLAERLGLNHLRILTRHAIRKGTERKKREAEAGLSPQLSLDLFDFWILWQFGAAFY